MSKDDKTLGVSDIENKKTELESDLAKNPRSDPEPR